MLETLHYLLVLIPTAKYFDPSKITFCFYASSKYSFPFPIRLQLPHIHNAPNAVAAVHALKALVNLPQVETIRND